MRVNKTKLTAVLVILYGTCAALWYQGMQGNDGMGAAAYIMSLGLIYVTAAVVIGIAGSIVYKFGRWLTS